MAELLAPKSWDLGVRFCTLQAPYMLYTLYHCGVEVDQGATHEFSSRWSDSK